MQQKVLERGEIGSTPLRNLPGVIFDTETTGLNDPKIIEAGWIEVDIQDGFLLHGLPHIQRFNPGKPSDLGALKTHHILEEELIGMPPSETFYLPNHVKYIICQNSDYDMQMVPDSDNYKFICTVGMSRKLWPEADSHSLGAMMYHLFGRNTKTREWLKDAHNAMADCIMTWRVVEKIIEITKINSLESLYRYSEDCRITTARMDFGKYKKQYLVDILAIEPSYIVWITKQPDLDIKIKSAAEKIVKAYNLE